MALSEALPDQAPEQPSGTLRVRLCGIEYAAPGINIYRFSSLDGQALPAFSPGAHIDVHLSDQMTRQYSLLWPAPTPSDYLIAVQVSEEGKGGSRALHYQSVVGADYRLSSPRNHFPLGERAGVDETCYLLAGGIGITPIISMYRQLRQRGAKVVLCYWAASEQHMPFHRELAEHTDSVRLFPTRTGQGRRSLRDVLAQIAPGAELYCCGPPAMIEEFDLLTAERPAEHVHRERFSAAPQADVPGDSFQVTLQRSGKTLQVGPDDSLLGVCLAAGVDVDYSCEEGICGACEVKVLAGQVLHRDSLLSAAQREKSASMLICCSRGVGNTLVLDI